MKLILFYTCSQIELLIFMQQLCSVTLKQTSFCYIVLVRIIAAGTVICLITRSCKFELLGKQPGKSYSQIMFSKRSESTQLLHMLYFEKKQLDQSIGLCMINVVCLITRSIEMIKHLYKYYLSNSRHLRKSGDKIVDLLTQIRNSVPFWVSNISFESKFGNLCFETHLEYCKISNFNI